MRNRREPLMSSGRRRSSAVIERMIAWMRSSLALVDLHVLQLIRRRRGSSRGSRRAGPSSASLHLPSMSSSVNSSLAHLALELGGWLGVELLFRLLDQRHHVAHTEDALGHAIRVELLEASSFSPVDENMIGLPVTALTDRAAPPRASPSSLVITTPSKFDALGELLGDVDRVLTGHRVDDQQHRVRLDRVARSPPARPSALRRCAAGRRCRRSARPCRSLAAFERPLGDIDGLLLRALLVDLGAGLCADLARAARPRPALEVARGDCDGRAMLLEQVAASLPRPWSLARAL